MEERVGEDLESKLIKCVKILFSLNCELIFFGVIMGGRFFYKQVVFDVSFDWDENWNESCKYMNQFSYISKS